MLGTVLALSVLGVLTLELFFIVSLVGFLVVVELTAPVAVSPRWRVRLRWLVLLGLALFGYVIVDRILETAPSGVF